MKNPEKYVDKVIHVIGVADVGFERSNLLQSGVSTPEPGKCVGLVYYDSEFPDVNEENYDNKRVIVEGLLTPHCEGVPMFNESNLKKFPNGPLCLAHGYCSDYGIELKSIRFFEIDSPTIWSHDHDQ